MAGILHGMVAECAGFLTGPERSYITLSVGLRACSSDEGPVRMPPSGSVAAL